MKKVFLMYFAALALFMVACETETMPDQPEQSIDLIADFDKSVALDVQDVIELNQAIDQAVKEDKIDIQQRGPNNGCSWWAGTEFNRIWYSYDTGQWYWSGGGQTTQISAATAAFMCQDK